MPECPECKGEKTISGMGCRLEGPDKKCGIPVFMKCDLCEGTGEITEQQVKWREEGRKMRHDRLSRDMSLSKESVRRKMSAVVLSHMERGKIQTVWSGESDGTK